MRSCCSDYLTEPAVTIRNDTEDLDDTEQIIEDEGEIWKEDDPKRVKITNKEGKKDRTQRSSMVNWKANLHRGVLRLQPI